ncbi:ABC transporter substrate-binding protein [Nisaea acidiphila]|uniref:ABC transporter substrate-binding protein n=1 Tax=Nisaea acidiphila TaxID=1862145 RepID=A0A9J7AN21_9PROT|nr:ABC transporter substrate-binding protein [Nisaea acidiphila]UUX49035.1 ABC transporter substrate-binding protein [Nisaea acidiphila]
MTKTKTFDQFSRRQVLAGVAAGGAFAAAGTLGVPHIARAADPVKVGVVHPVTGFLQFSGTQCRFGALAAIEEINAAGGIKALGGAKLEAVLGDAQSKAEIGAAEVEKFNEAGVSAIVGAYASGICLATTQAAAKYGIPHVVDVGVNDKIVGRGLENTFRFGPGFGSITKAGVDHLIAINDAAGKPTKSVVIVHENTTPFGSFMAGLLEKNLTPAGFEVKEVLPHPTGNKDFNNIALKIKEANPDLVIPSHYYGDGVLFLRTLQRQRVKPKAIYSVLGGASSQYRFVNEFPDAAEYVMDCNHWFDPRKEAAQALRKKTEAAGKSFSYEVFLAYEAMMFAADAMERAGSADRAKIIEAMASSNWSGHFMPYGPTKMVNGQNEGAQAMVMQVLGKDIEVVAPKEFATKAPVFPRPA